MSKNSLRTPYQTQTLSELAMRITDGSHFSPVPQTSGQLIANVKDMNSGQINFDSCTRISPPAYRELEATGCIIKKGDVLLSKDGTVGRIVVYDRDEEIGALSSICLITPKSDANAKFIGQALQSNGCIRQYDNFMSGSAIRRLVLRDIRKIIIPAPSVECQEKIAEILDTLDITIQQTEAIIEKLKQIKQGLLHDLFTRGVDADGELRPPQSQAPHLYKDSPLGWIPNDWRVGKIEEFVVRIIDYRGKTPTKCASGIPLITAKNVRLGYVDSEPREFISEETYDRWMTRGIPQRGDVLFTMEAPLGNVAQIETDARLAFAQRMIILQAGQSTISSFLKFLFLAEPFRRSLFRMGSGSTVEGIQQSTFRRLLIAVPSSLTEQREIVQALDNSDLAINREAVTLEKLRKAKAGLMEDLLSGRVRVTPLLDAVGA